MWNKCKLVPIPFAILWIAFGSLLAFEGSAKADGSGKKLYNQKCASCHSKDGKGKSFMAKALKVEAASLDMTKDKTTSKSTGDLLKIIQTGENNMPGYAKQLSDEETQAVLDYMLSLAPKNAGEEKTKKIKNQKPGTANLVNGKKIYKAKCASCHGKDGKGSSMMSKALKVDPLALDMTSENTVTKKDSELLKIISEGHKKMPAYSKQLSTKEQNDVLKYMRSLSSPVETPKKKKHKEKKNKN